MTRNRLTRIGLHFAFVAAFAMLGGAIRGFNLLLVLAGLMVAALFIQWRWSKRAIESISIERRLPNEAFAGSMFRVRFPLTNHSRLLPVWMLRIDDHIARRSVAVNVNGKRSFAWLRQLADGKSQRLQSNAQTGIGVLAARQTVAPFYDCRIPRRGTYQFGPLTASTLFPLSLMRSQLTITEPSVLDVYPQLLTLRRGWQTAFLSRAGGSSVRANQSGTDEGDFFGIREYQYGDNPKWIHWRTSARLNELAVRQFEQQRRFDVCVLLDAYVPEEIGTDAIDRGVSPSADMTSTATDDPIAIAETAISLAATFLLELSASPGNRIVLASAGETSDAVTGGAAFETRRRMFQMLARTRLSSTPDLQAALMGSVQAVGVAQDLIVVSPRSRQAAVAENPDMLTTLRSWNRSGNVRWLDASSPEIERWIGRSGPRSTGQVAKRAESAKADASATLDPASTAEVSS